MKPKEKLILLVEDSEDDVWLISRAFTKAGSSNRLESVRDGQEAMDYLAGKDAFGDREKHPLPWLVVLDLRMPRVDGFEVLKWIRALPALSSLVVVVLTSSELARDVDEAYRSGANSVLVKPLDFDDMVKVAKWIEDYWLLFNQLPQEAITPAVEMPKPLQITPVAEHGHPGEMTDATS
jgi:CheY-like chemotaxis protein